SSQTPPEPSASTPPQQTPSAGSPTPAPPPLRPPRLIHFVDAAYPEAARAQGREADVILELDVSVQGAVTAARPSACAGEEFDAPALVAARQLTFEPAR